jgi:hypothetical protein
MSWDEGHLVRCHSLAHRLEQHHSLCLCLETSCASFGTTTSFSYDPSHSLRHGYHSLPTDYGFGFCGDASSNACVCRHDATTDGAESRHRRSSSRPSLNLDGADDAAGCFDGGAAARYPCWSYDFVWRSDVSFGRTFVWIFYADLEVLHRPHPLGVAHPADCQVARHRLRYQPRQVLVLRCPLVL